MRLSTRVYCFTIRISLVEIWGSWACSKFPKHGQLGLTWAFHQYYPLTITHGCLPSAAKKSTGHVVHDMLSPAKSKFVSVYHPCSV